jgi:hypothetical protein
MEPVEAIDNIELVCDWVLIKEVSVKQYLSKVLNPSIIFAIEAEG